MTLSNIVAVALVSETFSSDTTEIAPVKSFVALASVIFFASPVVPAFKVVVPAIEITPVCCETSPVEIRAKLPATLTSFNIVAILLVSWTFAPNTTETAPLKLLAALVSVISFSLVVGMSAPVKTRAKLRLELLFTTVGSFSPAFKLVVPVTAITLAGKTCETAPVETRVKLPPTLTLSNIVAMALLLVSSKFPPDTTEIAPVKSFVALASVIFFVSAVKLVVPVILSAPLPSSSLPGAT